MKPLTPNFLKAIAATLCFFVLGCNYFYSYKPEFNEKQLAVLKSIDSKYSFENIEIQGKMTTGTGGAHNVLIIRFTNGKNLPTEDGKIIVLARQLTQQIKSILKKPKDFESYMVYFDIKTVNGNSTTTQSSEMEFKARDI